MFDDRSSPPEPAKHDLASGLLPPIGPTSPSIWKSAVGVVGGDMLARLVRDDDRLGRLVWLRLSPADAVPGVFCAALRSAIERSADPAVVRALAERLGPPRAAAPAAALAGALRTVEQAPFLMVIEDADGVGAGDEMRSFLDLYTRPGSAVSPLIVLIERAWWRSPNCSAPGCREIPISRRASRSHHDRSPEHRAARVVALANGRSCLAGDVIAAMDGPRGDIVTTVSERTRRWRQFSRRLTDALLGAAEPEEIEVLFTALRAGYVRPDLVGNRPMSLRPWLVPLEGGTFWLRPAWRSVLADGLARRSDPTDRTPPARGSGPWRQIASPVARTPPTDLAPAQPEPIAVTARLLGTFGLDVGGTPVEEWKTRRGLGVLKYLLAHPKQNCARDVLLEVFWPDSDPARARNRLHVALSAVRRSVRAVADIDIIEYHDHGYRIPPCLTVSVDIARFDELVELGRREEIHDHPEAASDLYMEAVSLYRGEFLADDPYESWTLLPRESMRIRYLDLLDRLAQLHIAAGRVRESMDVAQRILVEDDCREDAHRLLMRGYAHQGRVSQIDRQYELCRRTLSNRLGSGPSASTVTLHGALRAQALENDAEEWRYS